MPTYPTERCACPEVLGAYVSGSVSLGQYNELQFHLPVCSHCRARLRVIKALGLGCAAWDGNEYAIDCVDEFVWAAEAGRQLDLVPEGTIDNLVTFFPQVFHPTAPHGTKWVSWLGKIPLHLLDQPTREKIERLQAAYVDVL